MRLNITCVILLLEAVYYCYNVKHFFAAARLECLVSPRERPWCGAQDARRRSCSFRGLSGEQSDATAPEEQRDEI